MSPTVGRRLGWTIVAMSAALAAADIALAVIMRIHGGQQGIDWGFTAGQVLAIPLFGIPGALIVSRQPRNTIGWLLLAIPLAGELAFFVGDYATYTLVFRPGALPAGRFAAWVDRWAIVAALSVFIPLFLLFPDGRLPSRRWRPALWLAVGGPIVGIASFALTPGRMTGAFADLQRVRVVNPFGLDAAAGVVNALTFIGSVATLIAAFAAGISLVIRFKSRHGEEREQVKWLAFVGAAFLTEVVLMMVLTAALSSISEPLSNGIGNFAFALMSFTLVLGIPIACAMAILKYRLYDIDVVINKTVVYAALAAFITVVYVGIVVGLGALIGQGSSKPNLGLSILATAVVAVAFQPVRSRVQRFANRLVYGKRATPYEVLSEFSSRMASSYASEDLLPRMARILAEGTGARSATVWLTVGDELRPGAGWPDDRVHPVPLTNGHLPELPEASLTLPVEHRGELLGALSLSKHAGERLTPSEEHLAMNLASGAGLVLRNVRLTEELLMRLDELQASRQRIVAAQDQERRRLERNIHDGAQQQLVALAVKVRLARALTERDPAKAVAMLEQVESETARALEDLRDLARGIYPPLLADQGLRAALEAQAHRAPLPVVVHADGLGRYAQDVEAAVYFCVLEALQNVSKYAGATRAVVRLGQSDGELSFGVEDDGVGFDSTRTSYGTGLQGMADRLSALGGELRVGSAPGEGTRVTGRLPIQSMEPVR